MSLRRLALISAAMAGGALALSALAPDVPGAVQALARAGRTVDGQGADALVLALTGLLAWTVWAWGALGLALTVASALPGTVGAGAAALLRVVLPAAARHGAAVALGVGLAAPVLVGVPVAAGQPVPAADARLLTVPDWPLAPGPGVPDWPADPPGGSYVVVPGDCLWDIAERRLAPSGTHPPDARVAAAVHAWWSVNVDVIGPDPDLLRPGQVLRPPPP